MLSLIGSKYNPNKTNYLEIMNWQFLKIQAAHNLKKSQGLFKICLRAKVLILS